MSWTFVAANVIGSLVFIDDVSADISSRMNSEVYRAQLSAQIQPNAAKLIRWCFTVQMDNDPKHDVKATQEVLKAKKKSDNGQVSHLTSTQLIMLFTY